MDQIDVDIFIIGGGINGAGIARDAQGRGFSVCLAEAGDVASGTSSASTKLFHGGLRYLEYFEFRLVKEALKERETLLRNMPHISWPMRFVLPYHKDATFDATTDAARLLARIFPWLKGRRPAWMIRLGLFMYDNMGARKILPATTTLNLRKDAAGAPLKDKFTKAFEYSDCWAEDSRVVTLNLRDAADLGAIVLPRTRAKAAEFKGDHWIIALDGGQTVRAKLVVNAAGPWVDEVLRGVFGLNDAKNIRLVRGSHIVVPKKFDHDRAYFFQNEDSRIMFAIPYEGEYTLIGTTDADHDWSMGKPQITAEETQYLCDMASAYFKEPVAVDDVVWTYSGVRALLDDGSDEAASATRDYIIKPQAGLGQGRLLNVFGGKITTYRKLAQSGMTQIEAVLGKKGGEWTADAPLPGGDFAYDGFDALVAEHETDFPFVDASTLRRLTRHYGTLVPQVLDQAKSAADLGQDFGAGITEAEVRYLMAQEWARTADDILYRRTKEGLRLSKAQARILDQWMADQP